MQARYYTYTAIIVCLHIVAMLTAGIILVFTFDFPDILRQPMEVTLGMFTANSSFTVPAYYLFTLTGISFMTVALLLYRVTNLRKTVFGFLATVFGVMFGLTSSLGFVRWPFLMRSLGEALQQHTVDTEVLRLVYTSFHTYAGISVGENFAFWFEFLWMFFVSTAMLSCSSTFPKYVARVGQVLGLGMLLYSLEQFGGLFALLGPLNMMVHTAQLAWLLAVAMCLFNYRSVGSGKLSKSQLCTCLGLYVVLLVVSFG